jgi:hypothetical protein
MQRLVELKSILMSFSQIVGSEMAVGFVDLYCCSAKTHGLELLGTSIKAAAVAKCQDSLHSWTKNVVIFTSGTRANFN